MLSTEFYLWCHIIWCTAKSVGSPVQENLQFAHAKISDPYVTLEVQQYIVQFEISVDDTLFVKKYETRPDLSCVKSGSLFRKSATVLYVKHQISTVQILHHEE